MFIAENGETHSFARLCEDNDRGNWCIHDTNYVTCYITCSEDFCNDGNPDYNTLPDGNTNLLENNTDNQADLKDKADGFDMNTVVDRQTFQVSRPNVLKGHTKVPVTDKPTLEERKRQFDILANLFNVYGGNIKNGHQGYTPQQWRNSLLPTGYESRYNRYDVAGFDNLPWEYADDDIVDDPSSMVTSYKSTVEKHKGQSDGQYMSTASSQHDKYANLIIYTAIVLKVLLG